MGETNCVICGKVLGTFSLGLRSIELVKRGMDLPPRMKGTEWICMDDFLKLIDPSGTNKGKNIFVDPNRKSNLEILGLPEIATPQEIKEAFRKLSLKHHSDRGGDDEEFIKIKRAYDELKQGKIFSEPSQISTPVASTRTKIIVGLVSLGLLMAMGFAMGFLFG